MGWSASSWAPCRARTCALSAVGTTMLPSLLPGWARTSRRWMISERRLAAASKRASQLGLSMTFLQADAADLGLIGNAEFDLVFSSNGFFVWIADLQGGLQRDRPYPASRRALRLLRHPPVPAAVERAGHADRGCEAILGHRAFDGADGSFGFNWTLADLLNPLAASGLTLRRILEESPAEDSRFWQDYSYLPGTDDGLLDWKENPRAALPTWLALAFAEARVAPRRARS